MEKEHKKKMIAPITITVFVVLYYTIYFGALIVLLDTMAGKLLLGIIPVLLTVVMIYVCTERIKEIQEGEEDDLSKY